MKTILVTIISMFALAGCVNPYMTSTYFDNNEFQLLAELDARMHTIHGLCSHPDAVKQQLPELVHASQKLYTYTSNVPGNDQVEQITEILRQDVKQFVKQYRQGSANPTYCELKTDAFRAKTNKALEAVATKIRQ